MQVVVWLYSGLDIAEEAGFHPRHPDRELHGNNWPFSASTCMIIYHLLFITISVEVTPRSRLLRPEIKGRVAGFSVMYAPSLMSTYSSLKYCLINPS
jgi:hypothetical protein